MFFRIAFSGEMQSAGRSQEVSGGKTCGVVRSAIRGHNGGQETKGSKGKERRWLYGGEGSTSWRGLKSTKPPGTATSAGADDATSPSRGVAPLVSHPGSRVSIKLAGRLPSLFPGHPPPSPLRRRGGGRPPFHRPPHDPSDLTRRLARLFWTRAMLQETAGVLCARPARISINPSKNLLSRWHGRTAGRPASLVGPPPGKDGRLCVDWPPARPPATAPQTSV